MIRTDIRGRASDGTQCVAAEPATGTGEPVVRQVVLPDGRLYAVSDAQQIRTSAILTGDDLLAHQKMVFEEKGDCGRRGEVMVGQETVGAYSVLVWQWEYLDANQLLARLTAYRSPKLGCLPLRQVFEELGEDGQFVRRWETVATSIREEEPSEADLYTGDAYAEVTRSEFARQARWHVERLPNLVECGATSLEDSVMRKAWTTGKPDFNARWDLDMTKSHSGGGEPLPFDALSLILAHNEPYLDVVQEESMGEEDHIIRLALTTDGQIYALSDSGSTASAHWDGESLVLEYEVDSRDNEIPTLVERRLTLSQDGISMQGASTVTKGDLTVSFVEVWRKHLNPATSRKTLLANGH